MLLAGYTRLQIDQTIIINSIAIDSLSLIFFCLLINIRQKNNF